MITSSNKGSSLVVVMCTLVLLMVIAGVAVEYTTTINRNVQRGNSVENAVAVGDGCIEMLYANWRGISRTSGVNPPKTNALNGNNIPLPTAANFPNLPAKANFAKRGTILDPKTDEPPGPTDYDATFTISNYKVIAASPEETGYGSASASPTPAIGQDGGSRTVNYIASADVTLPSLRGNVVAKVRRVLQWQELSPWNYALFYVDPLEIHPGPQFVINGWVHTNSDLYTAHDTLTFTDKVTFADNWYIEYMPGDSSHGGQTPTSPNYPGSPNYAAGLPNSGETMTPARDAEHQPFGINPADKFDTSNGNDPTKDNTGYHELVEKRVGSTANDPFYDPVSGTSYRYYDQADFKIVVDDVSGNVTVTERTGLTTERPISGASPGQDKKNYTEIMAAITTGGLIQDNREGSPMKVTTVDVGSIVNSINTGKLKNAGGGAFNGILYVSASGAAGSKPAVKVVNGSILPQNGLTIASNNPVYIQGDYNTGGTGTNVPSNAAGSYSDPSNPPDPQVSGYARQPALVIGDAVSVLSSAWTDANSFAGLSSRTASPTTVNTAIVSGIVPSGNGNYSGGAENFPRFMENWTGKTFTYYGSMVELYPSQTATGNWVYGGNVYDAPTREWFFDNNFHLRPPPGTLMTYNFIKGRWYLL